LGFDVTSETLALAAGGFDVRSRTFVMVCCYERDARIGSGGWKVRVIFERDARKGRGFDASGTLTIITVL
jgi:hypothetical protein